MKKKKKAEVDVDTYVAQQIRDENYVNVHCNTENSQGKSMHN